MTSILCSILVLLIYIIVVIPNISFTSTHIHTHTHTHTHTLSLSLSLSLSFSELLHLSFTPFSTVLHVTARTLFGTWILLSRNCFLPLSAISPCTVELSPSRTSKNSESYLSVLAVVSTFYFHSIG